MGIRGKLFTPLLVVTIIITVYLSVWWQHSYLSEQLAYQKHFLVSHIETLGKALTTPLLEQDLAVVYSTLDDMLVDKENWKGIFLYDKNTSLLYPINTYEPNIHGDKIWEIEYHIDYLDRPLGKLILHFDYGPIYRHLKNDLINLYGVLGVLFYLFLIALMVTIELTVIRPVKMLSNAAENMRQGIFDSHIDSKNADEVGVLTRAFSMMRSSLLSIQQSLRKEIEDRRRLHYELEERSIELEDQKYALDQHSIVGITDTNNIFTYVNDSLCETSGYSRSELIGLNQFMLIDRDCGESQFTFIYDCILQGNVWKGELVNVKKNGDRYYTETTIVPFAGQSKVPYQFVAIHTDVTRLKVAKDKLIEVGIQVRQLLDVSPTVLMSCIPDGDFNISYVSNNVFSIMGYTPENLIGDKDFWINHIHPDDRENIYVALTGLTNAEFCKTVYRFRHKNGHFLWISTQMNLIASDSNDPQRILVSLTDITEQQRAEKQLEAYRDHLQEMVDEQTLELIEARDNALMAERAMSAFLANMSHELRTPLHGILSFSRFGMNKIDTAPKEKLLKYFTEIYGSGNGLLTLVTDLLDLSKLKAGKMSYNYAVHDMTELVNEIGRSLSALEQEKNIEIKLTSNGEICAVMDKVRISQVVRNLLSNALKFSPSASIIEVSITQSAESMIEVSVCDEGTGVPKDELATIFDPFVQSSVTNTGAGGTGLGLPISLEIVKTGHHGWIRAENRPVAGTCFTFAIPTNMQV